MNHSNRFYPAHFRQSFSDSHIHSLLHTHSLFLQTSLTFSYHLQLQVSPLPLLSFIDQQTQSHKRSCKSFRMLAIPTSKTLKFLLLTATHLAQLSCSSGICCRKHNSFSQKFRIGNGLIQSLMKNV